MNSYCTIANIFYFSKFTILFLISRDICISVQILAEEAANLEDLDLSAAKEQLSLAVSQAASGGGDEVAVAKAQIAQEVAEQVIKAAESA